MGDLRGNKLISNLNLSRQLFGRLAVKKRAEILRLFLIKPRSLSNHLVLDLI